MSVLYVLIMGAVLCALTFSLKALRGKAMVVRLLVEAIALFVVSMLCAGALPARYLTTLDFGVLIFAAYGLAYARTPDAKLRLALAVPASFLIAWAVPMITHMLLAPGWALFIPVLAALIRIPIRACEEMLSYRQRKLQAANPLQSPTHYRGHKLELRLDDGGTRIDIFWTQSSGPQAGERQHMQVPLAVRQRQVGAATGDFHWLAAFAYHLRADTFAEQVKEPTTTTTYLPGGVVHGHGPDGKQVDVYQPGRLIDVQSESTVTRSHTLYQLTMHFFDADFGCQDAMDFEFYEGADAFRQVADEIRRRGVAYAQKMNDRREAELAAA